MNPVEVGGAVLFGVDGVVLLAHGASNAYAFSRAINQAKRTVEGQVVQKMKNIIEETNDGE